MLIADRYPDSLASCQASGLAYLNGMFDEFVQAFNKNKDATHESEEACALKQSPRQLLQISMLRAPGLSVVEFHQTVTVVYPEIHGYSPSTAQRSHRSG
jgi:hypothetical protein